jgi:hypothetical protein
MLCCAVQVAEGVQTLIKVLSKSMDSSLTVDKVELATITRDDAAGKVCGGGGLGLWGRGARCGAGWK